MPVCPSAYPVEGGECEIRRFTALTPYDFCAQPDIVLHPGGKSEVKGIAFQFAFMVGEGTQKVADFLG